jgi:hypothetical protein
LYRWGILQFMPRKKSDSVKRSRKFRSLLLLDDKVPERFPVLLDVAVWNRYKPRSRRLGTPTAKVPNLLLRKLLAKRNILSGKVL